MSGRGQRLIKGIYSAAAARLYEPVVVKRAFPLFGGNVDAFLDEQGRRAVAAAQGKPILDLPVGTAYFTARVAAAHDGITVGVDIAAGMVVRAAERARDEAVHRLLPLQADVHDLPFRDASFAAVLCHNGLQVIPGLGSAVRELARVLEPGGMLLASVIHTPLGAPLPSRARRRLPTAIRPARDVVAELESAALEVVSFERNRLAYFLEAIKTTTET
ncbi:MAG TPA: class I SAM-dependent methyltransferase [Actinomycetota bacterium]|nr:class I SAM-dependent methyltransferase [Actinomycetota bacterium]